MDAIRQFIQIENNLLTLRLPPSFSAKRVEVIVMPADDEIDSSQEITGARRSPSAKLKGTRITGDILSPVVPEADWNALK